MPCFFLSSIFFSISNYLYGRLKGEKVLVFSDSPAMVKDSFAEPDPRRSFRISETGGNLKTGFTEAKVIYVIKSPGEVLGREKELYFDAGGNAKARENALPQN